MVLVLLVCMVFQLSFAWFWFSVPMVLRFSVSRFFMVLFWYLSSLGSHSLMIGSCSEFRFCFLSLALHLVCPPELTWLIIGSCLYISSFLQLRVTWFQSIPLSITGRPPNFARASSLPALHSHRHSLPPFHPSLSSLDYQP